MDWGYIGRIALYTLMIILAAAIVAGVIALVLNVVMDDGIQSDTHQASDGPDDPVVPDNTNATDTTDTPPETTDPDTDTNDDTDTDSETDPPPVTDDVTITRYPESKTMYAVSNVNARESYTTDSIIIGVYYQGDAVTVTGETSNGWYQIKYSGTITAFIRSDLLTEDAGQTEVRIDEYSSPVRMYVVSEVNVRESYTTSSQSFGTLDVGTEVTVTGKTNNGWYRVSYNDGVAFIKEEFLSKTKPEPPAEDGRQDV